MESPTNDFMFFVLFMFTIMKSSSPFKRLDFLKLGTLLEMWYKWHKRDTIIIKTFQLKRFHAGFFYL